MRHAGMAFNGSRPSTDLAPHGREASNTFIEDTSDVELDEDEGQGQGPGGWAWGDFLLRHIDIRRVPQHTNADPTAHTARTHTARAGRQLENYTRV